MGNYLVFELNKMMVKQEMQSLIRTRKSNNHSLILKVFQPTHNPDFQRIEDREIKYKGRLYDIIRETKQGNITIFCCIQDNKEEMLIAGFKNVQHRKITLALLHNLITQALPFEVTSVTDQQGIDFIFPDKTDRISPVYLILFAPPPELA